MLAATFNNFLEVFGDLSFGTVILVCAALFFAWGIFKKAQKGIIDHYEKQKEATEKLQKAVDAVTQYPVYRQQSIEKQKEIQNMFLEIKNSITHLEKRIDVLEHEKNERELNRLREKLIYNYRYYANETKNPMLAWSEMERESFFKLLKDYNSLGGNDFIHETVQPAMKKLTVIPMHEEEDLNILMASRK